MLEDAVEGFNELGVSKKFGKEGNECPKLRKQGKLGAWVLTVIGINRMCQLPMAA